MKKFIIFLVIILIIICGGIAYLYFTYKTNYFEARNQNMEYEKYIKEEITGVNLASVINKVVDNNIKNNVEKDEKGLYKNNDKTSMQVQVKILDTDTTYDMETLYTGGMDEFIKYYGQIDFKCTKIEYHQSTGKIKYMLFEQITQ